MCGDLLCAIIPVRDENAGAYNGDTAFRAIPCSRPVHGQKMLAWMQPVRQGCMDEAEKYAFIEQDGYAYGCEN